MEHDGGVLELTPDSVETTPSPVEPAADAEKVEPAQKAEETPAEEEPAAEAEPEAQPEAKLYKLPDGREVDADTLAAEFKEKFLPDYTRKSQELARLKGGDDPQHVEKSAKPWQQPGYVPKDWNEVMENATREAMDRIASTAAEEEAKVREVAAEVDRQVAALKAKDATLDENALFLHANKYGFRDLSLAYENMREIRHTVVSTEKRVLKNIKTREADPVSSAAGGHTADDSIEYGANGSVSSALEYLSRVKK